MGVFLVLIGPPGAGKGTQAKVLAQQLGVPHISTGDIFRANIEQGTELGKRVEAILASGELVPDDVTNAMVRNRLQEPDCEPGAVLDGYPRTPGQATALDQLLAQRGDQVDLAPFIRVSDDVILERLTGRRTDKRTGRIYHLRYNPPPPDAELEQRPDDREDTVRTRIAEYYRNTAPLLEYYRANGVLQEFDGEQQIQALAQTLLAALPARNAGH